MEGLIIFLWICAGFVAYWRMYFGLLKHWDKRVGGDWRVYSRDHDSSRLIWMMRIMFFILVPFGGFSLLIIESSCPTCWYYELKSNKEEENEDL